MRFLLVDASGIVLEYEIKPLVAPIQGISKELIVLIIITKNSFHTIKSYVHICICCGNNMLYIHMVSFGQIQSNPLFESKLFLPKIIGMIKPSYEDYFGT